MNLYITPCPRCPHCGRRVAVGMWPHVVRCAEARQSEIDRQRAAVAKAKGG